jgi:nitronate monooxygenase
VDEARFLESRGFDLVVASGSDAGGHRPSFLRPTEESLVGTFSLVPQIASAVGIPVVAAGGIADGRGIAAALVLGASAAQLGTRFLACDESAAPEGHKQALVSEAGRVTELTRAFSGRHARGIVNAFLREARDADVAHYPIQNWLTQPIRRAAAEAGDAESLALWAGQAAAMSIREPASVAFERLLEELRPFESLFDDARNA